MAALHCCDRHRSTNLPQIRTGL